MQNSMKKIAAFVGAAALAVSALTGCGSVSPLEGDISGEVVSNSGFVVEKGNYYYYINGMDDYSADNTFGKVVKAALMRISKADLSAGNYAASEIVVPSLMVAADYTSGIYLYGDRVYYATPTTAKNTSGEVENTYLDFKSTKLDGTDTVKNYYFRASDNSAPYRFVEVDGTVYCLHIADDSDLYSYNVSTGVDTLLVQGMASFTLASNKTDPGVYYTMNVQVGEEHNAPYTETYTQVYYVRADATEAPYTYNFDEAYLDRYREENGKDAMPYVNLGTIVLDGYGSDCEATQYNHGDLAAAYTPSGYTYTLIAYANGGLYYTRSYVDGTDSQGDGGWLFFLSDDTVRTAGWDSVSGNADTSRADAGEANDIVAYDTNHASTAAVLLHEGGRHSYLYADGNAIFRAEVTETERGIETKTVRIVERASSPTLLYTDADDEYGYLYYSQSGTNGSQLYRAVYTGEESDYNALVADPNFAATRVLEIEFASSWYLPEKIGEYLFFVNAEAIGSNSYNYTCVMRIPATNGALAERNERYREVMDDIAAVREDDYGDLANLMQYYYATAGANPVFNRYYTEQGKLAGTVYENTDYFEAVLVLAAEKGYTDTYLYSDYFKDVFRAYAARTGEYEGKYRDESGADYGVQSYYYGWLGAVTDADMDAIDNVYRIGYVKALPEETPASGLPGWAIALIVVGSVLVAAGVACAIAIPIVKKKKVAAPVREKLRVDTTDDKNIDVYADGEEESDSADPKETE